MILGIWGKCNESMKPQMNSIVKRLKGRWVYSNLGENPFFFKGSSDEGLQLHHFSSVIIHCDCFRCVRLLQVYALLQSVIQENKRVVIILELGAESGSNAPVSSGLDYTQLFFHLSKTSLLYSSSKI